MKFTLSWLKDHLETNEGVGLTDITTALDRIGLEVEALEDASQTLAPFKAAKIVKAEPHPDADKLRVCTVEHAGGTQTVVCGAPNARAGMTGVFAPEGATIPSNGMVLKPTKIRGVESRGMMVSMREMGLSDEHEGIIELDEATPVGTPIAEALRLDDPMIEIAITPNRPDALGVRGIARDLAAAGLGTLAPFKQPGVAASGPNPRGIAVEDGSGCLAFAGRTVTGLTNGASPEWMQARLRAVGQRPINALADITNYVMIDRNRPLHAYDAAKLTGAVVARAGAEGETFEALNGTQYTVTPADCVIADESGVLGLGGIIGGEASGCTAETTSVFLEAAVFDKTKIARTGRRLNLNTDARYRFERGIDPAFTLEGLELATALVLEICGGEASDVTVAGAIPDEDRMVLLPPGEVKRLTGLELPVGYVTSILSSLGFWASKATHEGGGVQVVVPSWRPDVHGAADLVEEIARIHGIDEVKAVPLPRAPGVPKPVLTPAQTRERRARRSLAARGLVEAVTWSFVPKLQAEMFGGGDASLALANPISADLSDMRPSLLPGLIAAVARNTNMGQGDLALFEVGQVFADDTPDGQHIHASGLRRALAAPEGAGRDWRAGRTVDAFDAKADAAALLADLGVAVDKLTVAAEAPGWYHPGRSGVFKQGRNVLARFGELHPDAITKLGASGPLVGFELVLSALPTPKAKKSGKARPALDLAGLQPVTRDFAFLAPKQTPAGDILKAAAKAEPKLITEARVFDIFEGGNLGDRKSVGIEITLQPRAETLTDEQIEAVSAKVVAGVEKATGAQLRG